MKVFDQNYIVSRGTGGPDYATYSVVLYIYNTAIKDSALGLAAAAGWSCSSSSSCSRSCSGRCSDARKPTDVGARGPLRLPLSTNSPPESRSPSAQPARP
jgi:hypothetical protein